MSKQEEIDFVVQVITHPAGFDLDLFGCFCIRPTDQGVWCVAWVDPINPINIGTEKCFSTPIEAATFFVNKRYEDRIGIDFEISK